MRKLFCCDSQCGKSYILLLLLSYQITKKLMLYDETLPCMKQNSLEYLKSSYELVYSIESLILRVT